MVRDVVNSLGVDATISEVEIQDVEQAVRLRFFGSPTVRINGQDIDPAKRSGTDYSFSCRLYDGSGSLPRALVENAIREAGRANGKGMAV
jgi:hypothetical protein